MVQVSMIFASVMQSQGYVWDVIDATMLFAMFTVFLQFHRSSMSSGTTIGNETLYTRGSDQLSLIAAREACNNMSYAILPGMRDARANGLLNVGEFAWIDGKEYTFCVAKNGSGTKEICRYVTVRREDTRENLTYICNKGGQFEKSEEMLPYTDAVKKCQPPMASLQVVENFGLPMVIPVNRTDWIKDYNATSIINSLRPGETVTQTCIGIVKLDRDNFEFGTTSCDENLTVICDGTDVDMALTLTTRDEMMPRLGDLKARLASNQRPTDNKNTSTSMGSLNLIFISLGPTLGILLVLGIATITIVQYRKRKLNQNLAYSTKYQKKRCSYVKQRQDREMLRRDNFMQQNIQSENKSLACNSFKVKYSTQGQSNNPYHRKGDFGYHNNDPPLASSQNPIDEKNTSDLHYLQQYALLAKQAALCAKAKSSGREKCLFPAREGRDSHKYKTMSGKERERKTVMYTDDKDQYENYHKVEVPSEYQGDNPRFRENLQV